MIKCFQITVKQFSNNTTKTSTESRRRWFQIKIDKQILKLAWFLQLHLFDFLEHGEYKESWGAMFVVCGTKWMWKTHMFSCFMCSKPRMKQERKRKKTVHSSPPPLSLSKIYIPLCLMMSVTLLMTTPYIIITIYPRWFEGHFTQRTQEYLSTQV